MPSWELMDVTERARMVLTWFPTLEPDVVQQKMREWSTEEYGDTFIGEQKALDDLMMMLRDASMSEEQRAQDRQRQKRIVKEKLK